MPASLSLMYPNGKAVYLIFLEVPCDKRASSFASMTRDRNYNVLMGVLSGITIMFTVVKSVIFEKFVIF